MIQAGSGDDGDSWSAGYRLPNTPCHSAQLQAWIAGQLIEDILNHTTEGY